MNKSLHQDILFRKIVVASTGLGLACMLGTAAAIRINPGSGLQFGWHWSIVLVAALGILWNTRFWRLVWQMQESDEVSVKQQLKVHLGILLLLGVGCFLYPIRFVEQGYFQGISRGLVTAMAFLAMSFWLLFKVGKGLFEIDNIELERVKNHNRD